MHIRKVLQNEWSSLQKLNDEVITDNAQYDADLIVDWALSESGEKYFQELVSDKASICFVAEDENGKFLGYIASSPKIFSYRKSRYLEVDNMGVLPEYRSQGIGEKLMEKTKKWAKNHGYQKLFVNSYFENTKAIRFYKKCGFREIDVSLEMEI